jgi:hypothetical protein
MREIEDFISRVCRTLRVEPELKDHIREELREHLLEAMECHVREGIAEEQAAKRAIEEFGSAETVSQELRSIHSTDLLSFMMKKAMSWKERTMKTEWKWNFVALAALTFTIAFEVILGLTCFSWFLPRLKDHFLSEDMFNASAPLFQVLFAMDEAIKHYAWMAALLIIVGWLLFEILYKKEGKPNFRLAIFAAVCMVTTLFFAVGSLSVLLPTFKLVMRLPTDTDRQLYEVKGLISELSEACKTSDWDAIRYDAQHVYMISQLLLHTGFADNAKGREVRGLPALDTSRLDHMVQDMAEHSRQCEEKAKSQDLPAVRDNLAALDKSRHELWKALNSP